MKIDPNGVLKEETVPISISIGQVQKFNYNGKYDQIPDFDKTL
jgi:hypothetical protein